MRGALCISLLIACVAAPDALAQDFRITDATMDVWVGEIWEHKVTVHAKWQAPVSCAQGGHRECPPRLTDNGLPEKTFERIEETARWACGLYQRDGVGPLNVGQDALYTLEYTYACAIR